LSCLSGDHRELFPQVVNLLREQDANNITVIGGGIIPEQDFQMLLDAGIKLIFTSGVPLDSVLNWIRNNIKAGVKKG
jgi:methylmalonyl-CoA mutase C-terminal domain/subunit